MVRITARQVTWNKLTVCGRAIAWCDEEMKDAGGVRREAQARNTLDENTVGWG